MVLQSALAAAATSRWDPATALRFFDLLSHEVAHRGCEAEPLGASSLMIEAANMAVLACCNSGGSQEPISQAGAQLGRPCFPYLTLELMRA
jgi:hypothetical protein